LSEIFNKASLSAMNSDFGESLSGEPDYGVEPEQDAE
jgi:hypothetical protein